MFEVCRGSGIAPRMLSIAAISIGLGFVGCSQAQAGLFDDTPTPVRTPPARTPPNPVPAPIPAQPTSAPAPVRPDALQQTPATQLARLPVPSEPQQRAAEQQIKEVFGQQMRDAHTPDDYRKLSATLVDIAAHAPEPDARFCHAAEVFR